MSQDEIRERQQDVALDILSVWMDIVDHENLTREEAEEILGYSWTNIATYRPSDQTSIRQIEKAFEGLRYVGFTPVITENKLDQIVIEVNATYDSREKAKDALEKIEEGEDNE